MNGHNYAETEQLAREHLDSLHRDAEAYREVEYGRYHSRSHALSVWLGELLLRWGSKLRERDGKVVVLVSTMPRERIEKAA